MAIDIEKYRNQQKQTAADAVKDLREAYAFISLTTNMPYVECEEVDYNDQIHLFARKEDAESMQKELEAKGDRVRILELKTVEIQVPADPKNPAGEKKTMYLNQVRQHLGTMPFIGVNAVCFHSAGGEEACIEIKEVLPDDFLTKTVHRRADSRELDQHLCAVFVVVNHFFDMFQMTNHAGDAVHLSLF